MLILKFILSSLSIFWIKRKNRIIFSSTHNLNYTFNSKYLFEYFLKHHKNFDIKFVINDNQKRQLLTETLGDHFIETNSLNGILYVLFAKVWVISSTEMPVFGIFQRFNRIVYYVGHGTPLKNIFLLNKSSRKLRILYNKLFKYNFTYILSTSLEFVTIMSNVFNISKKNIIIMGQPRNDILWNTEGRNKKYKNIFNMNGKNILYAPTWREGEEIKLFPFADFNLDYLNHFLEINKVNIFIRLHPIYENYSNNQLFNNRRISLLSSLKVTDIMEILSEFDMVITDYSSIFIDFLLTEKPVMFIPYDLEQYGNNQGFTVNYTEYTPGPKPNNQKEFQNELLKLLNNEDYYLIDRRIISKKFNTYKYNNCKMNADFIINNLK